MVELSGKWMQKQFMKRVEMYVSPSLYESFFYLFFQVLFILIHFYHKTVYLYNDYYY